MHRREEIVAVLPCKGYHTTHKRSVRGVLPERGTVRPGIPQLGKLGVYPGCRGAWAYRVQIREHILEHQRRLQALLMGGPLHVGNQLGLQRATAGEHTKGSKGAQQQSRARQQVEGGPTREHKELGLMSQCHLGAPPKACIMPPSGHALCTMASATG